MSPGCMLSVFILPTTSLLEHIFLLSWFQLRMCTGSLHSVEGSCSLTYFNLPLCFPLIIFSMQSFNFTICPLLSFFSVTERRWTPKALVRLGLISIFCRAAPHFSLCPQLPEKLGGRYHFPLDAEEVDFGFKFDSCLMELAVHEQLCQARAHLTLSYNLKFFKLRWQGGERKAIDFLPLFFLLIRANVHL